MIVSVGFITDGCEVRLDTYPQDMVPKDALTIGKIDLESKGILEAENPMCKAAIKQHFDPQLRLPTLHADEVLASLGKAYGWQPMPDQRFTSAMGSPYKVLQCESNRSFVYCRTQKHYWDHNSFGLVKLMPDADPLDQHNVIYDILVS